MKPSKNMWVETPIWSIKYNLIKTLCNIQRNKQDVFINNIHLHEKVKFLYQMRSFSVLKYKIYIMGI